MRIITFFIKGILDFIFPKNPKVLVLEALSASELIKKLPPAQELENGIIAIFDYSHPLVKEVVWEVKYAGNATLAEKLGKIIYDVIVSELGERNALDTEHRALLIPMPISDKRRHERGWNQAELLTRAIKNEDTSRILKYVTGQLVKARHTESQTKTTSKSERLKNLGDSMRVLNPVVIEERFVVLVDDVVTTGATFAEARRALREAGVKKILCVAVAH